MWVLSSVEGLLSATAGVVSCFVEAGLGFVEICAVAGSLAGEGAGSVAGGAPAGVVIGVAAGVLMLSGAGFAGVTGVGLASVVVEQAVNMASGITNAGRLFSL